MQGPSFLRLRAVLENVPHAIDFVTEVARAAGFDDRALCDIQVAVDEACANVVFHAYAGMEPGDMEISCGPDGQEFVVRLRDWGAAFDPDSIPTPDVTAPLEERTLGGLGLYLIRRYMDHVDFCFDPVVGNTLTMKKQLTFARARVQRD